MGFPRQDSTTAVAMFSIATRSAQELAADAVAELADQILATGLMQPQKDQEAVAVVPLLRTGHRAQSQYAKDADWHTPMVVLQGKLEEKRHAKLDRAFSCLWLWDRLCM